MYKAITQASQFTYEEKRSAFIAHLYPVTQRQQLMTAIDALKMQYPDARHYCWAYLIGDPAQPITAAFNDDGEPSGTAGKPMLHVLTQRGAGDTGVVVVRYFGGIKLGAGGLVRAYGQAVSKALDNASWHDVVAHSQLNVETGYENEPHIRHFAEAFSASIIEQQYHERVSLILNIPTHAIDDFAVAITQKTAGNVKIKTV